MVWQKDKDGKGKWASLNGDRFMSTQLLASLLETLVFSIHLRKSVKEEHERFRFVPRRNVMELDTVGQDVLMLP